MSQQKPRLSDAEIAANFMDYENSTRKAFIDSYIDLPDAIKAVVHGACLSVCQNHTNADLVLSGYGNSVSAATHATGVLPEGKADFTVGYVSRNRPSDIVELEEATEEVWEANTFMRLEFFRVHPAPSRLGKSVEFSRPLAQITADELLMSHVLCYEEVFSLLLFLGMGACQHLVDSGYIVTHVKIVKDPFHFKHISPELKQQALEEDEELEDQTGVITIGLTNPHAEFPYITLMWDEAVLIRDHEAWAVYDKSPRAAIVEAELADKVGTVSHSALQEEFPPTSLLEIAELTRATNDSRNGFLNLLFPGESIEDVKSEDVSFTLVFSKSVFGVIELEWTRPSGTETRYALLRDSEETGYDVVEPESLTTDQVEEHLRELASAGATYAVLAKAFKISVAQVMAIVMK